ncbi:AMP-binding protein [Cyanobium sp. ATX 6A2]|uniref:AMP-binding protein n=1 Tax=Cyanobium sp. ATX 6A2 TaxID=2823700 RepID=UPI0020CECF1A|nr:AMP-binding protein [Cyanobium sp. ATX 6A2]MCP9888746.1 AMP-binding protein [Cyanobium sp. ATX 6A2]
MRHPATIRDLLRDAALSHPDQTVFFGAEGTLSSAELAGAVDAVIQGLREAGVSREHRVAVWGTHGRDTAVALLAAMAAAVAAPVDPSLNEDALREELERMHVRAVLIAGLAPPRLDRVVQGIGLPLLDSSRFVACQGVSNSGLYNQVEDYALCTSPCLVLQTSGTTSRPKVVPLTHANLLVAAAGTAEVLNLGPDDCCLVAMPFFHIHGIVTCLLAPLVSRGKILFPANALLPSLVERFFCRAPTWMSASPTLLQALLRSVLSEQKSDNRHDMTVPALRFLRSASAALSPSLQQALEVTFRVPVIEAYGMTETASLICSNRLPPSLRYYGSVGRSAGPQVAILDEAFHPLPPGTYGEVSINGENVTTGYEGTESGWVVSPSGERWFLTGDEGSLDHDGVLRLTGRLKEMINRGGEKVIPRQVDEALMEHPAVEQALCFSVPHPTLGEDVAAVVVLRAGALASEEDLRVHCFARLAPHQVPSRIVTVDEVPKGPTGKFQRIGLAAKLDNLLSPMEEPPQGEVEELVGQIFAAVLGIPVPSRASNFFALGGDSLTGQQVISRLNSEIPLDLPATLLFRYPTLRMLAAELEERIDHALAAMEEGQHGP